MTCKKPHPPTVNKSGAYDVQQLGIKYDLSASLTCDVDDRRILLFVSYNAVMRSV